MIKKIIRSWHPYFFLLALAGITVPTAQSHVNKLAANYTETTSQQLEIRKGEFEYHAIGIGSCVLSSASGKIITVGIISKVYIVDNDWLVNFFNNRKIGAFVRTTQANPFLEWPL